jgi:hypothetical protein
MTRRQARRAVQLVLLGVLLAAAGCGDSPEDQARDRGKDIGEDVYKAQNAQTAQEAGVAIDDIRVQLADLPDDVPADFRIQLDSIAQQLRTSLQSAPDQAARRQAVLNARAQFNALVSDTNSVINEFRRGVRDGYSDASD